MALDRSCNNGDERKAMVHLQYTGLFYAAAGEGNSCQHSCKQYVKYFVLAGMLAVVGDLRLSSMPYDDGRLGISTVNSAIVMWCFVMLYKSTSRLS